MKLIHILCIYNNLYVNHNTFNRLKQKQKPKDSDQLWQRNKNKYIKKLLPTYLNLPDG